MTPSSEGVEVPVHWRARVLGIVAAPNNAMRVFRWVWLGWLIGWYSKVFYFLDMFYTHNTYPMAHPFITGWRANAGVMIVAYVLPLFVSIGVVRMTRRRALGVAFVGVMCSCVHLMHLITLGDATFVSSLWVALWMLWLAWNSERQDIELVHQARRLAMMIVSLMFLGGFVGKLTPEYWSGEMFSQYRLVREALSPAWLTQQISPAQHHTLIVWLSRCVIVIEGGLAVLWVVPFRRGAPLMILAMLGMMGGFTFTLLCIFGCLIGMLGGNFMWQEHSMRAQTLHEAS